MAGSLGKCNSRWEVVACLMALREAKARKLSKIIMEGDSLAVVSWGPGELSHTIMEI